MKEERIKQVYQTPEAEVCEMEIQAVICQSGTPEQYQNGEWNW